MLYSFNDILSQEIYESAYVMVVVGKYTIFNNMVCDTLKAVCKNGSVQEQPYNKSIDKEFGIQDAAIEEDLLNAVDFSTFMQVIGVASINGKWYCRVELSTLTKKQLEQFNNYIKNPSENGILVVVSTEWKDYRYILKNRSLRSGKHVHLMELSFPNKNILKTIVNQMFADKGLKITISAIEFFMTRMGSAYDKYDETIEMIADQKPDSEVTVAMLTDYMKGIEYFDINDFMDYLVKPMSSDKTNGKKILKIMMALESELGAKQLVYSTLKKIDENIEYRILINKGIIPIGIHYFYKDVIDDVINYYGKDTDKGKAFDKINEWSFRRKAIMASLTSLRDWQYMHMILESAIGNNKVSEAEMDMKCQKALYELCTRSVLTESRINNILDIENVFDDQLNKIDSYIYKEDIQDGSNSEEKVNSSI